MAVPQPPLLQPPLLASLYLAVVPAMAWPPADAAARDLQTTLAATSDYVHRGVSRTDGDPALQAGVSWWRPTGGYIGAWGSNVAYVSGAMPGTPYAPAQRRARFTELDAYAGYSRRFDSRWVVDVQVLRYLYPGAPAGVALDYTEATVNLSWRDRWYASVSGSPDYARPGRYGGWSRGRALAAELSMQQPLSAWITLGLGAGYQELADAPGGGYAFAGSALTVHTGRLAIEAGYYGTDRRGRELYGERLAGSRAAVTLSMSF